MTTRDELERAYEARVREVNPQIGADYDRYVAEEYEGPYGPDGSDGSHIVSFVDYITGGGSMNPFDLLDHVPPISDRETRAEVACNLRGEDPNDPEAWDAALAEVDGDPNEAEGANWPPRAPYVREHGGSSGGE